MCVIITGSFAGLTGCIQVPHQTWVPTQQYSGYQEVPNFFVCKDFVDKNANGKLEHDEIKDMNPASFKSGDNITFVLNNPTSWSLKARVRVYSKKEQKLIQKSPMQKVPSGTTWMTHMKAPANDSGKEYTAIFFVDGRREYKQDFTVLP